MSGAATTLLMTPTRETFVGDVKPRLKPLARERAACLQRAITALIGALTVEEVLEAAFRDALPIFSATVAVAFLLSDDGTEFRALRLLGPSEEEQRAWQRFPADTPVLIADSVRAQTPLHLANLAEHDARYPHFAETRAAHGEGASVAYPFLIQNRAIGGIGLLLPEHRPFDEDDDAFLTTLAGACAQALERTRLHEAERAARQQAQGELQQREQAQAELAAAYEREKLINEISQAMRRSADPAVIQQAVVTQLGRAVGADRCYYVSYDQAEDECHVGPDWHRAGLKSIAGDYRMSDYPYNREAGYRAGEPQVVEDVLSYASPGVSMPGAQCLRALIRVPLQAGSVMTALVLAMADVPRRWTPSEVRLVKIAAAETQAALEAARDRRREHTIAEQLQAALLPAIPVAVPGLSLASRHQPALVETEGVGGDFCDVFTLGKSLTFLVLGDLSGKGLAAAVQVATVRNMVRYAVYRGRTLAGALTNLNAVLVDQGLLSGFSTLFVGAFDASSRTLVYVNCGQEPALVWRSATGGVEPLPPTGPVLGGIENAVYAERVVSLATGDVLAVFSDGLTEAGPSRQQLLGVSGVASLLQESALRGDAASIAPHLMAGVRQFARGILHDDVCLLIGVVAPDLVVGPDSPPDETSL